MKKKILVTGGNGRFAKILKENNNKLNLFFVSRKEYYFLEKAIFFFDKKNQLT